VRLLDLVEEHDALGQVADLGEQPAFAARVTQVPSGDAQQLVGDDALGIDATAGEGVAVHTEQGLAAGAEQLGQLLCGFGFPNPGGPAEEEDPLWPVGLAPSLGQPGDEGLGDLAEGLILADDGGLEKVEHRFHGEGLRPDEAVADGVLEGFEEGRLGEHVAAVALHRHQRAGLVEQLDGLVGLEPGRQVLLGEVYRLDQHLRGTVIGE